MGTQFHGGNYIGAYEKGELYKLIVVFMMNGLKQRVPTVINAYPETTINGKWLANKLSSCVSELANPQFKIQAIVTDNHSATVSTFQSLLKYPGDGKHYINIPVVNNRLYLFFDTLHLLKNVRNNLFNTKKLIPAFTLTWRQTIKYHQDPATYVGMSTYDRDKNLDANLRHAPKFS